jgi:hypothetical protein
MSYTPYIIDSFRGGISDEDDKGIKGSFKYGYSLDIHKRRDSLTCQQAMLTIGGSTVTDFVKYFVCASDGSTFAFGDAGKIYAITGDSDHKVTLMYTEALGEIKGAAEWGLSDGTYAIYWATNTTIARKVGSETSAATRYSDWSNAAAWKTELVSAESYHPMKRAAGGLVIGNGNYLGYVEYDGDWNPIAMNIEPGNVIKCLESRGDYVLIGSENKDMAEEGHIWSWISTATNYVQKKKIPVKGVNALLEAEFGLLQGGIDGELFVSDFSNTEPQAAVSGRGYSLPGGVTIDNDLALFGIYGGDYPGLWSFGRRSRNRPSVLNQEYRFAQTVASNTLTGIGGVVSNNSTIYAGWKTAAAYGIDCVSSTTKATALYEGLEFDANAPHLTKHFRDVHLIMSPLPSGASVAVKVKADKASSWTNLKTADGQTTYTTANSTDAVFLLDVNAKILEIGVTLTPTGNTSPEVLAIIIYVEKSTQEY